MAEEEAKTEIARKVEIDGDIYYFMPIDVACKYSSKILAGFFVPLSAEKRVRIQVDDDDIKGKLEKYREKGLTNILFAEEDYYSFLKSIKRGLTGFFMKDDDLANKSLNMQQTIFLVNKAIGFIGLGKEVVAAGEEVTTKVLTWVKTVPNINNVLKPHQKENQDEFLKNMMVAYTSIGLAQALNWTTPQIRDKIVQACLFSDITLSSKDFMQMIVANGDQKKYTKKILNHPKDAGRILSRTRNSVAKEVITAVEQHHELPDGSGYPGKIKGLAITQISAITIVARMFINKLIESDFSFDDRKGFIDEMMPSFKTTNFAQPCKALYIVFDLEEEFAKDKKKAS